MLPSENKELLFLLLLICLGK